MLLRLAGSIEQITLVEIVRFLIIENLLIGRVQKDFIFNTNWLAWDLLTSII